MSRKLPPALAAKFFDGVETNDGDTEWQHQQELRSNRLGLGADPRTAKKQNLSLTERRGQNMIKRRGDASSSDEEQDSRASLGSKP